MTRLADLLRAGTEQLRAAGIDGAPREARLLLAHSHGIPPVRLTLHLDDATTDAPRFHALIDARAKGMPVAKLLGYKAFWRHDFRVTPDVLDPRPETEALIAQALEQPFARVLDLGTGSGCILLSLLAERPEATGMGVDLSAAALDVARDNARALGVDRVTWRQSDWFSAVDGQFDLIVSNPPYIAAEELPSLDLRHEPRMALTDEGDGLSAYRVIAAEAQAYLQPAGRVLVEIGWQQGAQVAALFAQAGFAETGILPDLDGRDRVVFATSRPD